MDQKEKTMGDSQEIRDYVRGMIEGGSVMEMGLHGIAGETGALVCVMIGIEDNNYRDAIGIMLTPATAREQAANLLRIADLAEGERENHAR